MNNQRKNRSILKVILLTVFLIVVLKPCILSAQDATTQEIEQSHEELNQAFFTAVTNGDVDEVEELIAKGIDVNVRQNENGPTPLLFAAMRGDVTMVNLLIANGARSDVIVGGATIIRRALYVGRREVVEAFLSHGAEIPALHKAAAVGDVARLSSIIEQGVGVDTKDEEELTPLVWAVCLGKIEAVEVLITAGADVNTASAFNEAPPLYFAVMQGDVTMVKLLIANGADVNAYQGFLGMAVGEGYREIVELLIANGADVNANPQLSQRLLTRAVRGGYREIVEILIANGAEATSEIVNEAIEARHSEVLDIFFNDKGLAKTILLLTAQQGDQQVIEQVLDHGVDINSIDEYGLTPLHHAAAAGYINIVELLLSRGARTDIKDNAGRTPLHYAAGAGIQGWIHEQPENITSIELLLARGANINSQDNIGRTPLHYAALRDVKPAVEALLNKGADAGIVDDRGYTAYSLVLVYLTFGENQYSVVERRVPQLAEDISFIHDGWKDVLKLLPSDSEKDTTQETADPSSDAIAAAIKNAGPGETVYISSGVHKFFDTLHLAQSGERGRPIRLYARAGETPVLDFSGTQGAAIFITGAYWHLKGLTITGGHVGGGVGINGDGAHDNVLEQISAYSNQYSSISIENDAAHNLILNCDVYRNFDFEYNGDATEGFLVTFAGEGNIFIGCRSWQNSDDGFDLWGASSSVRLERCYVWRNGVNIWNHPFFSGNSDGFKLGLGKGRHVLVGCLAWGHDLSGATLAGNESGVILHNCTFWNNAVNYTLDYGKWSQEGRENCVLVNNIAYEEETRSSINPQAENRNNSWSANLGLALTNDDFLSLDDSEMSAPRNPDGSMPQNNFLKLAPRSTAIDKGVDVNMPYIGKAPDLGAFEYDPNENFDNYIKMLHQYVRDHDIEKINKILEAGTDINEKDWLGYAPLHWACYFGYADLVTLLIDKGANPNLISDTGRNCMEIAIAMDYGEIAELLRKHGADE